MTATALRTTALLACLLPWLAGCAVVSGEPTPPHPRIVGVAAQNLALQEEIREGHGGQPDVFVPLAEAESAVAAAQAQPRVEQYAAGLLQQARAELAQARQLWRGGDRQSRDDAERLVRAETHAHDAQRLAQIARYTALRESNRAQLRKASAQLQRRRAQRRAQAPASLLGRRVVPGPLGALAFQPGTARLTADAQAVIAKLAALLKNHPAVGVGILAHTDNSEPSAQALQRLQRANPQLAQRELSHEQLVAAYHVALSNARARAVAMALVRAGIAPRRIGARGYGSSRPRASNATAAGRAANERVVAIIIPGPDMQGSPLAGRASAQSP